MPTLKKMISRYMYTITFFMVVAILLIVCSIQVLNEQRRARENAKTVLVQMTQLLEENQRDLEEIKEQYTQTCLRNAEAIAYIIQYHPETLESVDQLKKIAQFMEVDEIHIIDHTGRIINGTHPQYYDYTFDSGEQIGFFKPMLEDKSLKLCQDITPNTAEAKMMQYSALWSENGEFIVQVGMEPVNVMKVTEKNELSHIFSHLRVNVGANFYAIDAETGEIVGSTVSDDVGKIIDEIGIDFSILKEGKKDFHATINGTDSYCVFGLIDGNYIGRTVSNDVIYQRIPGTTLGLTASLLLIAFILVFAVTWYMNKYVVNDIHNVNMKLHAITQGNLEETVDMHNSREFAELSNYINEMVKSLLSSTDKMSYVLNRTNMRIGVYEYNELMKNIRFTEYVPRILAWDSKKTRALASDKKLFMEYMDKVRENTIPNEDNTFRLDGDKEIYIKIEELNLAGDVFGIVMDVTDAIYERRKMESERDIDALTGLYNRRGIENRLDKLFKEPNQLGHSALIMIDGDGLKSINDIYGHDKGDIYLKKMSEVLGSFGSKQSVVGRLGGDEFVIFLYGYASAQTLFDKIESLKDIQDNSQVQLTQDVSLLLRFSYGVELTNGRADYKEILKEADEKMYVNKRERKKALAMQVE